MNLNNDAKDAEQKSADKTEKTEKAEKAKEKKVENKGEAEKKSTGSNKPNECAGCGKAIKRKTWYYRNSAFYCTKKCYKRKLKSTSKESEKKSE